MSSVYGYIYIITNNVNDKVYVGKTTGTIEHRWAQHLNHANKGSGFKLHNAMRKYGPENFKISILEKVYDSDIINGREIYYIQLFDSIKKGYNLTVGGDGVTFILEDDEQIIIELYKELRSFRKVGKCLGVCSWSVHRVLKKHQIDTNSLDGKKSCRPIVIKELQKEFISISGSARFLVSEGYARGKFENVRDNISCIIRDKKSYLGFTFAYKV